MTPTPDVTTMTITNDQNPHTAREAPGGHGRRTRPARREPSLARIPGWAAEPGLTALGAITRAPEPPEKTSNQEHATSRADPEAGL
jgi:hypothetical protein